MRNIRLVLEYDGTDYCGWQSQAQGERTVQSTVLESISRLTGELVSLRGAGRTDSGVHALGQVASFRTESSLPEATIKRALNALLPWDIRVREAAEADESFNPRYSASGKRYFYLISNSDYVSPFARRFMWHLPGKLNVPDMEAAGRHLSGEHDFRAFMGSGSGVEDTVREITRLSVEETEGTGLFGAVLPGRFIRVTVEGPGFLRHMVRNIAGTLVEVARGKIFPEAVKGILESRDRGAAGPTAPARGLFLERVLYVE